MRAACRGPNYTGGTRRRCGGAGPHPTTTPTRPVNASLGFGAPAHSLQPLQHSLLLLDLVSKRYTRANVLRSSGCLHARAEGGSPGRSGRLAVGGWR